MPSDWLIMTIAECAADEPYATQIGPFGKALTPDAYVPSGVPLLRGVNVNRGRFHDDDFVFISEEDADRLAKFESFPGDVLLVHKGSLGHIGLMPERRRFPRYIMGNSMLRVRCDRSKLLPEYLHYWLRSPAGQHYLLSRVSQVGVPQIQRPLTTLREAALPVPPLSEQEAITGILGALDDKIEQNRWTARALERLARAIFRAWFVDFEPVKAKAAGETSFPSMPQPVFDALPTRLVDSEIGPVPERWEVKPVSIAFDVNPTRVLRKGDIAPYLDMKNMPTEGHAPESWIEREVGSGMKFINGDTLVARITPCLEKVKPHSWTFCRTAKSAGVRLSNRAPSEAAPSGSIRVLSRSHHRIPRLCYPEYEWNERATTRYACHNGSLQNRDSHRRCGNPVQ